MHSLRALLSRVAALFRSSKLDADLDEELRSHIDLATEENRLRGMSPRQARTAALRGFGGVVQTRENYRIQRGLPLLEILAHDLRFALRQLSRSPGFTFVALLTLALGIGATSAIFSVVDAVMLKPLPFPNSSRLIRVGSMLAATGTGGIASYPDFLDLSARNHSFDAMAAVRTGDFTLIGPSEPVHLQGAAVSAQLFSVLGVTPAIGRDFLPQDDNPAAAGGADSIILSNGLWQREFGSDPSILGRVLQLGEQRFTVIGVMPRGFQYPIQAEPVEIWTTLAIDARGGANSIANQRGAHYLDIVGLLRAGVPIQKAQAEMASIASALNQEHPENKPRTVRLKPEVEYLAGDLRTPLLVLLGTVGCILLIVCANLANLQLARATRRHKEMAVRAALGASRLRVACQLLSESVLLSLLGGGLGLVLALVSFKFLLRIVPAQVPRLDSIGPDPRLLAFALLLSLLTGILFGLAPALRASKISLNSSLNAGGRDAGGAGHSRMHDILVVSEIALAVIPLLASALLIQSLVHLTRVDPGFDPHHVLTFQLDFQLDSPEDALGQASATFFRETVERIAALPGVTSASAVASLPLTGDNTVSSIEIEGEPTPLGSRPSADFNAVEPGYFPTVGIALLAGRDFTLHDGAKSNLVAIVNSTLARRFFPNQNPIGKHVRPGIGRGPDDLPMREIVGVIADVKQSGLGSEAAPEVYVPLTQSPFTTMFITARTANDPRSIIPDARRQIAALNKRLPLYHVKTLDQYFADSLAEPATVTLLLSGFAVLAVLLACLGVYGVISYTVVQRTHEIGVRMALGADSGNVLRWVLGRGFLLALAGVSIGLAGSFALTHLLASLLFGVGATDPVTFVAAPIALLAVAVLAGLIPARRAASINPMVALRSE